MDFYVDMQQQAYTAAICSACVMFCIRHSTNILAQRSIFIYESLNFEPIELQKKKHSISSISVHETLKFKIFAHST